VKITQLVKFGSDFLNGRGLASLESELLLSHVLGVDRSHLISHSEDIVDSQLVLVFKSYLSRLGEGEPLAYIVNEKEFFGRSFFVDNRVLVPRPETEMLVVEALNYLMDLEGVNKPFRILEIGVGSANIAVSIVAELLKMDFTAPEYVALDVSFDALDVARVNVQLYGVEDGVYLFQSDLLEVLNEGEYFDLVLANLPYIGTEGDAKIVAGDVEKFEPSVALFGGKTGLELYKKMFHELRQKNIKFGLLMGEFGYGQGKGIIELLNNNFEQPSVLKRDEAGIDRIFLTGLHVR